MIIISCVDAFVNKFEKKYALPVKNRQNVVSSDLSFISAQYLFRHVAQKTLVFLFLHATENSICSQNSNKCVVYFSLYLLLRCPKMYTLHPNRKKSFNFFSFSPLSKQKFKKIYKLLFLSPSFSCILCWKHIYAISIREKRFILWQTKILLSHLKLPPAP